MAHAPPATPPAWPRRPSAKPVARFSRLPSPRPRRTPNDNSAKANAARARRSVRSTSGAIHRHRRGMELFDQSIVGPAAEDVRREIAQAIRGVLQALIAAEWELPERGSIPPSSALVSMNCAHVFRCRKLAFQPISAAGTRKKKSTRPKATPSVDAANRRPDRHGRRPRRPTLPHPIDQLQEQQKPDRQHGDDFQHDRHGQHDAAGDPSAIRAAAEDQSQPKQQQIRFRQCRPAHAADN